MYRGSTAAVKNALSFPRKLQVGFRRNVIIPKNGIFRQSLFCTGTMIPFLFIKPIPQNQTTAHPRSGCFFFFYCFSAQMPVLLFPASALLFPFGPHQNQNHHNGKTGHGQFIPSHSAPDFFHLAPFPLFSLPGSFCCFCHVRSPPRNTVI